MVRENPAFIAAAAAVGRRAGHQPVHRPGRRPAECGLPSIRRCGRSCPTARVAYVDIDPVVLSHARALLATSDGVTAVAGDLGSPEAVFTDPELRAVIDPAWPVCVILGAVLHFMPAGTAREVTAGYARLLAAGSCLVISVAHFDDERISKELAEEYTAAEWHNHSRAGLASFFGGLDMVGPGIGEARTWRSWQTTPVWRGVMVTC